MKSGYAVQSRNVIRFLIIAQILVILFDLPFLVLDWMEFFILKAGIYSFVYAVKLKIEFVVLNQLLDIASHGIAPGDIHLSDGIFSLEHRAGSSSDVDKGRARPGAVENGLLSLSLSPRAVPTARMIPSPLADHLATSHVIDLGYRNKSANDTKEPTTVPHNICPQDAQYTGPRVVIQAARCLATTPFRTLLLVEQLCRTRMR